MDIDTNQISKMPVSDDPELAKILSGVNGEAADDGLQFEAPEIPEAPEEPETPEEVQPVKVEQPAPAMPSFGGLDLDAIKGRALQDLRPLVEKLTVSNEEKFDIYLLFLRSSDDNTLIEPAYNAARNIEDETKRANALLDVIKEIDYFKSK